MFLFFFMQGTKKHLIYKFHTHWHGDFPLAILQIRLCALYNGSRRMKICLSIAFGVQVIVLSALMLACHVSIRSMPISLVIIACTSLRISSDSGTISWNSRVHSHICTKLVSNMVGTTGFIWRDAFRACLAHRDQKSEECGISHRTGEVSSLIGSQYDFGERQRFILPRVRVGSSSRARSPNAPPKSRLTWIPTGYSLSTWWMPLYGWNYEYEISIVQGFKLGLTSLFDILGNLLRNSTRLFRWSCERHWVSHGP